MDTPDQTLLTRSQLLIALSQALDLAEGQLQGHALRCCWIGMQVARRLSLKQAELEDLYYTLLLKDTGCSSNAARLFQLYGGDDRLIKRNFKMVNSQQILQVLDFIAQNATLSEGRLKQIQRILNLVRQGKQLTTELIQTRCEQGATIARRLGFNESVADGVRHLDEHYNGRGRPDGLRGPQIPLYSRIALLAQIADVFYQIGGPKAAQKEVWFRSGTWFDPVLVQKFRELAREPLFWEALNENSTEGALAAFEPQIAQETVSEVYLDTASSAFADIIDAKSPYTGGHSHRVAMTADILAEQMGIDQKRRRWFYRGSLLHDIGKLGISNAILDKPGPLTEEEFNQFKNHPRYTQEILSKIPIFRELAQVAGAHQESLDGKGYPRGLVAQDIGLETRILTLANAFNELSVKSPSREAMPSERVLVNLEIMCGSAIDGDCLKEFKKVLDKVLAKNDAFRRDT